MNMFSLAGQDVFQNKTFKKKVVMRERKLGTVLRAHAHEFAQHMHMKVETYAHAHTQVEETPEARR